MAPMVSHLKEIGAIEAKAFGQKECFEAGVKFANVEGIVPAPEATHAVKGAIDAALNVKRMVNQKLFFSIYVVMVILICKLMVIILIINLKRILIMRLQ